jgi:hypothetical protein
MARLEAFPPVVETVSVVAFASPTNREATARLRERILDDIILETGSFATHRGERTPTYGFHLIFIFPTGG